MPRLILFNKPYNVLARFTDPHGRSTLADFIEQPNFYPAGRLDLDSEGLLLLTDDGRLQHEISDPRHALTKTYWAQVEGSPDPDALRQLRAGVRIADYVTKPAQAQLIDPPTVWPRDPPIRVRQQIPTAWLELIISEGRNRQVRHMTAAVGHPTLRLVRFAVGDWTVANLAPGAWREIAV